MNRQQFARVSGLGALALVSLPSFAAINVDAATGAVADAATATGTVLAAIIGVVAVVWALRKVIALFGR